LIAGALDLLQACIQLGWNTPLLIASGLLGSMAEHGGVGAHILGILLLFFIALSAAAVYYAASRRFPFMKQYPLLCGLYFGATVMLLIILPLSALHATEPSPIHDFLWGLVQKMIVVGLPIAYSVRCFMK
jgi:4-hydroxybenzoate polyprenyltransferase